MLLALLNVKYAQMVMLTNVLNGYLYHPVGKILQSQMMDGQLLVVTMLFPHVQEYKSLVVSIISDKELQFKKLYLLLITIDYTYSYNSGR